MTEDDLVCRLRRVPYEKMFVIAQRFLNANVKDRDVLEKLNELFIKYGWTRDEVVEHMKRAGHI
jgi:hypothetical protein